MLAKAGPAMQQKMYVHDLPAQLLRSLAATRPPWHFHQHVGQAVVIPFGCFHAVKNLQHTVKVCCGCSRCSLLQHMLTQLWPELKCLRVQFANDFCAPSSAGLQHEACLQNAINSRTHTHTPTKASVEPHHLHHPLDECKLRDFTAHRMAIALALHNALEQCSS